MCTTAHKYCVLFDISLLKSEAAKATIKWCSAKISKLKKQFHNIKIPIEMSGSKKESILQLFRFIHKILNPSTTKEITTEISHCLVQDYLITSS